MRRCALFMLLVMLIIGCSKKKDVDVSRTNFAEVTIGNQKFIFDQLQAVVDTSFGIKCHVEFDDKTTNSYLEFKIKTGSGRLVNSYHFPGDYFPGNALEYLDLVTYVNGVPGSYVMDNSFTVNIDNALNGRIHGSLSGKVICNTCATYNELVTVSGEFELPYSYQ